MTVATATPDVEFTDLGTGEPDETTPAGSSTWYFRGHNFVLAWTTLVAGDVLERQDQPDEYVLLLPYETGNVEVRAGDEVEPVAGKAVVMVPPGASSVIGAKDCTIVRLFSSRSGDIVDRARNRDAVHRIFIRDRGTF